MITATNVGKRYLHAKIRLDELCELAQAVAEASLGIIRSRRRLVLRRVSRLEHIDRVKSFFPGAMKHAVGGVIVHSLERARGRRRLRIAAADGEVVDVIHRNRGL